MPCTLPLSTLLVLCCLSIVCTHVFAQDGEVYLPALQADAKEPPTDSVPPPVLKAIENGDGDGQYTVSWFASSGATGYELQ